MMERERPQNHSLVNGYSNHSDLQATEEDLPRVGRTLVGRQVRLHRCAVMWTEARTAAAGSSRRAVHRMAQCNAIENGYSNRADSARIGDKS